MGMMNTLAAILFAVTVAVDGDEAVSTNVISFNISDSSKSFTLIDTNFFVEVAYDSDGWEEINGTNAEGTYAYANIDNSTMDVAMSYSWISGAPYAYGGSASRWGAGGPSPSFTLMDIPYEEYYVVVYLGAYATTTNGYVSNGTTTYYFDFSAVSSDGTPELTADTDPADGVDPGNYAVFGSEANPLSGDITLTVQRTGTGAAFIGGVQVVEVPSDPGEVTVFSQPSEQAIAYADAWNITVNGVLIPVYQAIVHDGGPAYFCSFDFNTTGSVAVCAEPMSEMSNPVLRPLSAEIAIQTNRNHTISFHLSEPGQYCLEARSYSLSQPLFIFANPAEENVPNTNDSSVLYYGPGYHEVTTMPIGNKTTVYLAGGAYLKVYIAEDETPVIESDSAGMPRWSKMLYQAGRANITVRGRGIIDFSGVPWHGRTPFTFQNCTNLTVEGITILDSPGWTIPIGNNENVLIDNVKLLGHRENSDGIDIISSRNVTVTNCFVRTGDDGICVKSMGSTIASNICVGNCVVWNDRVRAVGVTGESARLIRDIQFKDIDILYSPSSYAYNYALAVDIQECGPVEDVLFEDIRVESANKLLRVAIRDNALSYSSSLVSDVTFRDIQYLASDMPFSEIRGAGSSHTVSGVLFDNLTFDGTKALSTSAANITIGGYVSGIVFE